MRHIFLAIFIFVNFVVSAESQQTQQPSATTKNSVQSNVPSNSLNQATADKSNKCQNNYGNRWLSLLSNPTDVFTGLIAFFTIGLFVVGWDTARRELRAYVSPENATLADGMMLEPPEPAHTNEPGVVLSFRNSGRTPAYKVVSWAKIEVIEPINEDRLVVPPLPELFSNTLGAGGTMPKPLWFGRALTANEIADISARVRAIYLFGRVEYKDAFKRKQFTNFRLRYQGQFPPPKGVIFLYCEKGNDAT